MDVRKFLEERLGVKQKESESDVEYRLRLYNKAYDEIDGEEFDKLPDSVAQWINDCSEEVSVNKKEPPEFPEISEEEVLQELIEPTEKAKEEMESLGISEKIGEEIHKASDCKIKGRYRVIGEETKTIYECTAKGKGNKIISFCSVDGDILRINGTEMVSPVLEDDIDPDEYIDIETKEEEEILPEDHPDYFNKGDRDKILSTFTKEVKEVATRKGVKVDKHGYTRVEAFIDAMKEGGTKEDIIIRSNQNYVLTTKKGELNDISKATFYYKIMQRLCHRLGLIVKRNNKMYFQNDEDQLHEKYLKAILW